MLGKERFSQWIAIFKSEEGALYIPSNCDITQYWHNVQPVQPTRIFAPLPNWSVLDLFNRTCSVLGSSALSTAISPQLKCITGLYAFSVGTVISPDRKNPKKQSVAAAHSIRMSASLVLADHKLWICRRVAGVLGSLNFIAGGAFCECTLLIPACTSRSRGRDDYSLGSGSPSVICIWRIPAK